MVESWLTHTSEGIWPEHTEQAVRLRTAPGDANRRGAAVLTADTAMTALGVLLGPPVGGSRPIGLNADPDDTYSFVSDLITKSGGDAFLDVGGWGLPGSEDFAQGDLEHLASLCSELAAAMTPLVSWNPPQDRVTRPWPWVAQPPQPTMYCEITWAGAYPRVAEDNGGAEFPTGERSLDQMVAFTYHLFYAAREAPDSPGARHSEGQWEAVTLFFPAELGRRDRSGRLVEGGQIAERPEWVVISQGQDRGVDGHWTALEDYGACELLGEHPIVYVAKGTHRNYFHPVDGETFDPTANPPHGPDTTSHDNSHGSWIGVDQFLVLAAVLLGIGALIVGILLAFGLVGLAVFVAVVVAIAILVLLIMWIVSVCTESSDRDAGEDVSPSPEPDEAGPDGPQSGGDGSEEPSGPGPAPGGSPPGGSGPPDPGATVGLPNSGSPTGRSTVFPDIRVVEHLLVGGASSAPTSFPSDRILENPPWWTYGGRWGVRVRNLPGSGTWESGWRRVDDLDRDWPYFAAERLLIVRNGGPRQSN